MVPPSTRKAAPVVADASGLTRYATISVPLAWSWRLSDATKKQRNTWELIGDGQGVHWPDIDEDISANGMLTGILSRRPQHIAA